MKQEWLHRGENNNNLLVFFTGWSCEAKQFSKIIDFLGYDILIIYDYTKIEPLCAIDSKYSRVAVLAWSLGVYVASRLNLPKEWTKIAINGTLSPVDDNLGIPIKSFELTLSSLLAHGIDAFNRRISKGVEAYFTPTQRDIESVHAELLEIYNDTKKNNILDEKWDYSIVSSRDLIFPSTNQLLFWNKRSIFAPILIDAPHYPFNAECVQILKEILEIDK